MKHQIWVWTWFYLGMLMYWVKRGYYLITGPNPVANTVGEFVKRCWAPLLVRGFLETLFFWVMFTPGLADRVLAYFGWSSYGWAVGIITQVAPVAALVGHTLDSFADVFVSKVPGLKDVLPQMPGPIKP